jgi:monoterpene epsilon-lactone hydrolase
MTPVFAILVALTAVLTGFLLVAPYLQSHYMFLLLVRVGGWYMKFMPRGEDDALLTDNARAFNVLAKALIPSKPLPLEDYRNQINDAVKQLSYPLSLPKYATKIISELRNSIYARDVASIGYPNEKKHVILYAHSGGFTSGHPTLGSNIYRHLNERVKRLDLLALNYALCPEYTIEDSLEDMVNAFQFLTDQGYKKITMLGDSAGGGLVVLTILDKLSDDQKKLINAAVLVSPWLDLTRSTDSFHALAKNDIMLNEATSQMFEQGLLAVHSEDELAEFSVLTRLKNGKVTDLPKVFLTYSSTERLRDECEEFFKGISVNDDRHKQVTYAGLTHIYPMFVPYVPEAVETVDLMARFIQ